jgi:hypothetical protein
MLKYKKDIAAIGILLICGVVTYWRWFFDFSIQTYGDWGFYFPETQKEFLRLPYIWNNGLFGFVDFSLPFYPMYWLWGLYSHFFDFPLVERLTYFYPSVIFTLLTSYFLGKKVLNSIPGAFVTSIVYTFNTYFLLGRSGHLTLMSAFGLAPLALLLFIKTLESKNIIYAIICGLSLFLIGTYEFRSLYLIICVLLLYLFTYCITSRISIKTFLREYAYTLIVFLLPILLNLFWIIGIYKAGFFGNNEILGRQIFGDGIISIEHAVSLSHPFWTGSHPVIFIIQPIPLYFWITPCAAFLGLFLFRKDKYIIFFGILAIIGILLTKQNDIPFGSLYKWLYFHFPGFSAFRESSKFFFYIALGYSVLIGAFTKWIFQTKQTNIKILLFLIIIISFLYNSKSFINGEADSLFQAKHVPSDYLVLKDFLLPQKDNFRTLWIPADSRWGYYDQQHPKLSFVDLKNTYWNYLVERKEISNKHSEGDQMIQLMKRPEFPNLLKVSSVRYIIVPDKDPSDIFFSYYGYDKDKYVDVLSTLPFLRRVDSKTSHIVVYEFKDYTSLFYLSNDPEGIDYIENVRYEYKNPTEYTVYIDSISKPVYLQFSQAFHPAWDIYSPDNIRLQDIKHTSNLGKLNTYMLDSNTYSAAKLKVYFTPQNYIHIGSVLSLITFITALCAIGFIYLKRRKNG